MNDRDRRLHQFFAGYFHQDWDIDGAISWADVALQYIRENPRAMVLATRDDLRSWLEDSASGGCLPAAFGCDYNPRSEGMDDRTWIQKLAELIEHQLAA